MFSTSFQPCPQRLIQTLIAGLAFSLSSMPLAAASDSMDQGGEEPDARREARFSLQFEGLVSTYDTTVAVNRDDLGFSSLLNLGTSFDVEDTLGIEDEETSGRFRLQYRWGKRHRLRLSYFEFTRRGSRTLTSPTFRLFDRSFNVNLDVESEIEFQTYVVEWGYAFYVRPRSELGLFLGLNTHLTRLEVRGVARVTGQETDEVVASAVEETDPTIPLPVVGLFGGFSPSPRVRLGGSMRVFALEFGDYSGSLFDFELFAEYLVLRNVAFGLNGSLGDIDVEADSSENNAFATLDLRRQSIGLYLRLRFGGLK